MASSASNGTAFYPFEGAQTKTIVAAYIANIIAGFTLNSLLIYCIFRKRHVLLRAKIDQSQFIVILCQCIWSFFSSILATRALLMDGWDYWGCNFVGTVLGAGVISEIGGQGLMAFERYCAAILRREMTDAQLYTVLSVILGTTILCSGIAWIPSLQYVPRDGNAWCFFDFASDDIIRQLAGIMVPLICGLSFGVILIAYISIYRKVVGELHNFEKYGGNLQLVTKKERSIYIRCITLMISFFLCFGLEFSIFLYELMFHHKVPVLLGQVSAFLVTIDTFVNPIVCVWFNVDYQNAISEFLHCSTSKNVNKS